MPRCRPLTVLLAGSVLAFGGLGMWPVDWASEARAAQPERSRKIDLRPKFTKGQEIRLKIELTNRNRTGSAAPGRGKDEGEQSGQQELILLLKVKDANPETGATLDLVYEQIKFKIKTPDGDLDFDSSKPKSGDPTDEVYRAIVGTTLSVELDAKGNVKNVSGGGVGGELAGALTGSGALKDLFGKVLDFSPSSGQAAVGESWTTDSKMEAPGGTWTLSATNTLRSESGGKANIDIKGKVTLDPATSGAGPQVKVNAARYEGKAVWNTERGMIESMDTTMRVESEHTNASGGKEHGVREATMKVTRMKTQSEK